MSFQLWSEGSGVNTNHFVPYTTEELRERAANVYKNRRSAMFRNYENSVKGVKLTPLEILSDLYDIGDWENRVYK